MSSILACHPQRPLRGEADSKEENEMFNDNRFAAINRGCISATIRDNARRRRVLPRVRPPAENRPKIGLHIRDKSGCGLTRGKTLHRRLEAAKTQSSEISGGQYRNQLVN